MFNQKIFKVSFAAILLSLFFLISSSANAASSCKGMSKSKCGSANCSWVNSYKRKDGAKVNAYCRSKGKSSSAKKEHKKDKTSKNTKSTQKKNAKTKNKEKTKSKVKKKDKKSAKKADKKKSK